MEKNWDTVMPADLKRLFVIVTYMSCWSRKGYSDWLRAGQSGDQIPVAAKVFAPVQTVPGYNPASCTMGTGSSPGINSGRGVTLNPHPLLVPWS
jgi:hypothetical protein